MKETRIDKLIAKLDSMPNFKMTSSMRKIRKDLGYLKANQNMISKEDMKKIDECKKSSDLEVILKNAIKNIEERIHEWNEKEIEYAKKREEKRKEQSKPRWWDDQTQSWLDDDFVEDLKKKEGIKSDQQLLRDYSIFKKSPRKWINYIDPDEDPDEGWE